MKKIINKILSQIPQFNELVAHLYKLKWKNFELKKEIKSLNENIKSLDAINVANQKVVNGLFSERTIVINKLKTSSPKDNFNYSCPICNSEDITIVGRSVLTDQNNYPIYFCNSCTHKFLLHFPSNDEISSWYQGMQYSIKNRQASNISSYEINEEWNGYLESRIQAMDLYVKKRFNFAEKLFIGEVGCLEGTLLKKLADDGNEVLVFEINTEVVKRSNSLYSLSIYDKNIEIDDFSAHRGALDCILSFHTFEHLKSPRVALSQCASMLKIGGGILIEVPCDDDELDNPEHFHFFNPSTLRKLLEEYFTNVEIHRNSYFRNGEYELGSIYGSGIKK